MDSSASSQTDMEQSFSIAAGEFTDAEREYRLRKGLIYENSQDETLDISTDIGSANSSNLSRSHIDSLVIFEENERLYSELLNKSRSSANESPGRSPGKASDSPLLQQESESPSENQRQMFNNMSKLNLNDSALSPGYDSDDNEKEEDKENEFKGPMTTQRILFQDNLDKEKVRDPLYEIKGIAISPTHNDPDESWKSQDELSDMSDNEICTVPCTQDVSLQHQPLMKDTDSNELDMILSAKNLSILEESTADSDSGNVNVVACTQQNESHQEILPSIAYPDSINVVPLVHEQKSVNLNETYTSETLEESLSEEIVPCTQAPDSSLISEVGDISRLGTTDASSVQCSQGSTEGSKDELNDTIAWMEHALKEADKLEAEEKLAAEQTKPNTNSENNCLSNPSENGIETNEDMLFKTPLKHNRVQFLKNKKMASPSPPRQFANALLQQRCSKNMLAPGTSPKQSPARKPAINRTSSSCPINTSTPKRTPVAKITPVMKKNHTPGRGGTLKTPISAKVDSGLKSSTLTIGLSPVAKYIYEKPVPSTFSRVPGIPNSKAASLVNTSLSRIPLPPSRSSQTLPKPNINTTPGSQSKKMSHHALRTSTYFNMTSTPPQIIANEKVVDKKRFQPLQYTAASKVKALDGKVESPRKNDYVAHRHTGMRDESGNASFIQNTMIQKRNIPAHSRLTTPKNEIKDTQIITERSTTPPIRSGTFVIKK